MNIPAVSKSFKASSFWKCVLYNRICHQQLPVLLFNGKERCCYSTISSKIYSIKKLILPLTIEQPIFNTEKCCLHTLKQKQSWSSLVYYNGKFYQHENCEFGSNYNYPNNISSNYSHWFIKRSLHSSYNSNSDRKESKELADEILLATKQIDVMADSVPSMDVINLVESLHSQGFESHQIRRLLSRRLWLLRQSNLVVDLTDLLLNHDFQHSLVCRLLERTPYHLHSTLEQIPTLVNNSVSFFYNQGMSPTDLSSLLNKKPEALFLDVKVIASAIGRLKSIFSAKDVKKILKRSPSLLIDSWSDVYRKYEYAVYQMVYSNDDIIHSALFSHSFEHIKNRHLFLVRSGLFVAVSHKLDPILNPNPRLSDVVDSSDSAFLKLFPVTDLEEYGVFCQLREIEQEDEDDRLMEEFSDGNLDTDVDLMKR